MSSHQTVRLSPGKHETPDGGMCVMELASALAGEPFSDSPQAVSRVIVGLLREYNDAVDDDRRQLLIPYAALSVGTRAPARVERARARRCLQWANQRLGRPAWRWRLSSARLGGRAGCGAWAARSVRPDDDIALAALRELLDELIGPVPAPPRALSAVGS
jgi:hypothetical protein